jgi:flagellar basal-body rod protein FlgB
MSHLETRMDWLQQRQQVLTQNIANADTPGYHAKEVAPLTFQQTMEKLQPVQMAATSPMHMQGVATSASKISTSINHHPVEIQQSGNTVNIEDETMKASQNVMDYQLATNLYKAETGMLMKAAGKGGS